MQFRAYRVPPFGLVVDLQSDLIDTPLRVGAPLAPVAAGPPILSRLEPVLTVDGVPHVLRMGQLLTVPRRLLREPAADLSSEDYAIRRALDMLFSGF